MANTIKKKTTNKGEKKIKHNTNKNQKYIDRDIRIQLILLVVVIIALTMGATYAYFQVVTNNNFNTVNTSTSLESVGSVILSNTNANMALNLNAVNMMQQDSDIIFYASSDGKTTTPTIETLGTIEAVGNGNFKCEYDLVITASNENNMYTVFQGMDNKSSDQIVLTANGNSYDFNTENLFPINRHYVISSLEEGTEEEITASLKIVNKKNIDQSDLAGSSITINFDIENFNCELNS